MKKLLLFSALPLVLVSCDEDPVVKDSYNETKITIGNYSVSTFNLPNNAARYLVVFESGLGDYSAVWKECKVPDSIQSATDVVVYDRAGYGKSTSAPAPRDVDHLRADLEQVVNKYANGRKVILVAHSLGGYIIRDYAIKNPSKVAALLFVDPSQERYNGTLTQEQENVMYNTYKGIYGENHGVTMESRQLVEDAAYMRGLSNLPSSIPVMVITSMKTDATHSEADRQSWYAAHEELGTGVTDFTHFSTTVSDHYIMKKEPNLVKDKIRALLAKLP